MDGKGRRTGRWRCRRLLMLAFMAVVVASEGLSGESRARLVNNGYEGIVVGLSPAVEEANGPALVEALKKVLLETSRGLYEATDHRAYFRSVTILVPKSWTTVNITHDAGSENYQTSDIRVDAPHPTYQHQPYTEQPGDCGDPGQYIHLTPSYLLDDSQSWWFGPRGKALLLEWAKLRWGVFDELGYHNDPNFPLIYTDEGGQVSPNLCANRYVLGRIVNRKGQRCEHNTIVPAEATLDDAGGSPGTDNPDSIKNCLFIPYKSQRATSSLLSYNAIRSDKIVYFCGGPDRKHNAEAPTKQNLYCAKRSAWDVISQHPDFKDEHNLPTNSFHEVEVRVVQQADANYALVLDYSGSMSTHSRIQKLQRTARRWLMHEVVPGSHVALIRFSSSATLVRQLTKITDESSRKALADAIGIDVNGGTSIGSGLRLATTQVLAKKRNPVIILITDGEENEAPNIAEVLSEVMTSGARVITVAFGAKADPKLENVAAATGGKTYTVNDLDEGMMLQNAFQGALTYQPTPSYIFQTVTLYEEEYKSVGPEVSSTFTVDSTVGGNLTLELQTSATVTSNPVLTGPDGQEFSNANYESGTSTWILVVPIAKEGEWRWKVGLTGSVTVKVTSVPRNPSVQPITTRAWMSTGAKQVNAGVDKVTIFAEVKQGNNPVVNAHVRALVTPPNENDPEEVYILLDNGQGADRLAGDGIYSRYMTKFPAPGRYSVKAEVTDGGTALINKGFLNSPTRKKREVEEKVEKDMEGETESDEELDDTYMKIFFEGPSMCCGSVVPLAPEAPSTGSFTRTSSGGSLKVSTVPQGDVLAPSRVRDLMVRLVEPGLTRESLPINVLVTAAWTAPGDDLDSGVVSGYEFRVSSNKSELTDFDTYNSTSPASSWSTVDLSGHHVKVEGGTSLLLNLSLTLTSSTTFFALRAWDEVGTKSEVSNVAALHVAPPRPPPQGLLGLSVWAVTVLVVFLVVLVVTAVVILACLVRRRQKTGIERLP